MVWIDNKKRKRKRDLPPYRRNGYGEFECPICHLTWDTYSAMFECYQHDMNIVRGIRTANRDTTPVWAYEFNGYSIEDQMERKQERDANAWLDDAYCRSMDELLDEDNRRIEKAIQEIEPTPEPKVIDTHSRWFNIEL